MNFDSSTGKKVSLSKLFNQPVLSIYTTEIYISVYREEDNEFIFSVMFIYHSIEQRKLFNLIYKAREYKTEIAKQ